MDKSLTRRQTRLLSDPSLPNMALRLLRLSAILAVAAAQQNVGDPINDFCRRHHHQTCIIDSKLYIDGGKVYYGGSVDNGSVAEQSEYAARLHRNVTDQPRHSTTLGECLGHKERL